MAVFDKTAHEIFCATLAKAGFFSGFAQFSRVWGFTSASEGNTTLNIKILAEIVKDHTPNFKLFRGEKVLCLILGRIHDWDWQGVIVIQRGGIMEIMVEGDNGIISLGSTMVACWDEGLRLAPNSAPSAGPPYLRPWFNGDTRRLSTMVGDLLVQFERMKDIIQSEMSDLPAR